MSGCSCFSVPPILCAAPSRAVLPLLSYTVLPLPAYAVLPLLAAVFRLFMLFSVLSYEHFIMMPAKYATGFLHILCKLILKFLYFPAASARLPADQFYLRRVCSDSSYCLFSRLFCREFSVSIRQFPCKPAAECSSFDNRGAPRKRRSPAAFLTSLLNLQTAFAACVLL